MVITSVPAGWGSAPDRDVMLGKGAVVGSHAGWASVLTGDVPSTNDEGSEDEVVVTDTVLADVTAVIRTDETGAEDVGTGWSSGVADGVGDWSCRPSSPLGADELESADKDKPNCPLADIDLENITLKDLTVVPDSSTSVQLEWKVVPTDGHNCIRNYNIQIAGPNGSQ